MTHNPKHHEQLSAVLATKLAANYVNCSVSALWERLNPKSPRYDAGFPRPLHLSARSRGFLVSELDAWLDGKASGRNWGPTHD